MRLRSRDDISPGRNERDNLLRWLGDYGQALDDFMLGLKRPSSEYELMAVKQRYILEAAGAIKKAAQSFDFHDLSLKASILEAAARAYGDSPPPLLQHDMTGKRCVLTEENYRFLRSRLKDKAHRANRSQELFCREMLQAPGLERSALKFLLDVTLELPMGAWECAACIAVSGRCEYCDHGLAHGLCSEPGSAYQTLHRSREAVLVSIRDALARTGRRPSAADHFPENGLFPETAPRFPLAYEDLDTCWEYDVVEICD